MFECRWMVVWVSLLGLGCEAKPTATSEYSVPQPLLQWVLDRPPTLPVRLNTDFDGKVILLGAKLDPVGTAKPGSRVHLTLFWQCRQKVPEGWKLFTHVVDGTGARILNLDDVGPLREPVGGKQVLGPWAWVPGKVYADAQEFTLPSTLRGGKLQILAGLWKGSQRLPIRSGARDREDRAVVATLDTAAPKIPNPRVPSLRANKLLPGQKVVIDGKLDEEVWSRWAGLTGPFRDVSTGEPNGRSDLGGSARLLWDDTALYVVVSVVDATVTGGFDVHATDPHLWTRDTAEIMIDPDGDGDNRDYYEIQINPQNLVFDSQFDEYNLPKVEPNGPFGHQDWSSQRVSAVRVEGTLDQAGDQDQGYVVEARIPWKAFSRAKQIPPKVGDEWRFNFYAMENNSGVAWSPILGQGNFHKASRFGRVLWADKNWNPPQEGSVAPSGSAAASR